MDVTPTDKMFRAMQHMVDVLVGEEPNPLNRSAGANARRIKREGCMNLLHDLVAISMREGVNRAVREAHERVHGPQDGADRSAMDKAKDDAAGDKVSKIVLPH